MKKLLLGMLGALCVCASACDQEIPSDEVLPFLGEDSLCVLSGGVYHPNTVKTDKDGKTTTLNDAHCVCGGVHCSQKVNCTMLAGEKYACGGMGYAFLTEGLCTMKGIQVCAERVNSRGEVIGYYTECTPQNRWADEKPCTSNNSCKLLVSGTVWGSQCGDCQNDGVTCINGIRVNDVQKK
jgi:hypothetical protein